MTRVDLFTTIHKGVRALLFDGATAAARIELGSDRDVDLLGERLERMLALIEEHEQYEHAVILPVLAIVDPELARTIALAHEDLDAALQVVRRTARALTFAASGERGAANRDLLLGISELTVKCLAHLHHEETVVNAVLWGSLGERDLVALGRRMFEHVGPKRRAEWRAILAPAVSEAERVLLFESCVEAQPR